MSSVTSRQRDAVHVHGPALRVIRNLLGRSQSDLAEELECTRSWIAQLELGHSRACSSAFYTRLIETLGLTDRRALLACPYGEEQHGKWNPDSDTETAPMVRPVLKPHGPPVAASAPDVVPVREIGRHRAETAPV